MEEAMSDIKLNKFVKVNGKYSIVLKSRFPGSLTHNKSLTELFSLHYSNGEKFQLWVYNQFERYLDVHVKFDNIHVLDIDEDIFIAIKLKYS